MEIIIITKYRFQKRETKTWILGRWKEIRKEEIERGNQEGENKSTSVQHWGPIEERITRKKVLSKTINIAKSKMKEQEMRSEKGKWVLWKC